MDIIRVSARSRSTAVAGAIAGVTRDHSYAEVQAIGASAGAGGAGGAGVSTSRGSGETGGAGCSCLAWGVVSDGAPVMAGAATRVSPRIMNPINICHERILILPTE